MVMWGVWETGGNVGVWEFRSRISSVVHKPGWQSRHFTIRITQSKVPKVVR